MPPDHGAAAVRLILADPELTALWLAELDEMRDRMRWVRDTLAAAGQVGPIAMSVLGTQNGLFSMLPLSSEQILAIRERHGVYMAGTGHQHCRSHHRQYRTLHRSPARRRHGLMR
jgi:aromatic-amino-acid transaminase